MCDKHSKDALDKIRCNMCDCRSFTAVKVHNLLN